MTLDLIATWSLTIAVTLLGAMLLLRGTCRLIRSIRSRTWPQVEGEIIISEVTERPVRGAGEIIHSSSGYIPIVEYSFPHNGRTLRGCCLAFGEKVAATPYSSARDRANLYRPGTKVPVYFNPKKPSIATLRPGRLGPSLWSLLSGLALVAWGASMASGQ